MTDTVTGLIWLKDAACLGGGDWAAANGAATVLANSQCGLMDKSSPGDWRLPTKNEWSATIAHALDLECRVRTRTETGPDTNPSLTNDAGTACYGDGAGSSFAGLALVGRVYWSSSTYEPSPWAAVVADLESGVITTGYKSDTLRVWPVRGGSH